MSKASSNDFNKLSAIVDQFLIENDLHDGFFPKALAWACRGLREIRLDTWNDVKTVLLDVTDRKTAKLPQDYVDYTKIGAPCGQYVITLGLNDDLKTTTRQTTDQTVSGLLSQHLPNGLNLGNYDGYNFFNFNGSTLFGFGGGLPSKGYWKIHDAGECKELLLDYDYCLPQVYVEYITDGFEPCGETIVHPYLYDYTYKFMEMRFEKKNNPKATANSIDQAERDVYWAEKRVRARRNNLDPQTVINISRAEIRLTPHI